MRLLMPSNSDVVAVRTVPPSVSLSSFNSYTNTQFIIVLHAIVFHKGFFGEKENRYLHLLHLVKTFAQVLVEVRLHPGHDSLQLNSLIQQLSVVL